MKGSDGLAKAPDVLAPGRVFSVTFPFVREEFTAWDGVGYSTSFTWKPGTRSEQCAPDDFEMVADGEGLMTLEVVSTHKPGTYPVRVFYTRRWTDPTGKSFGKSALYVRGIAAFRQLSSRYRYNYRIVAASLSKEREGA